MPFTVTMPKLSPTMETGVIAKWHVKPGQYVESGDLIMEVSTDKATVEYNALDSGWLRKILVKETENAAVNQPIAIFTEEKTESIEGYKPKGIAPQKAAPEIPVEEEAPQEIASPVSKKMMEMAAFVPEKPLEYKETQRTRTSERVFASPLAKKIAKEKGLDLSSVKGTGPGHRIVSKDLELAQPLGEFSFGTRHELPKVAPGSYEEETLTPMRKIIGQRLQESKTYIPHFYVHQTIQADALVSLRDQLQNLGIKVSYNDLVVKACALALRQHPNVNSGFNSVNQTIVRFKTVDISVAATLKEGLITPIVRHADHKNVSEISAEIRSLVKRAKEGKLDVSEYKGGSFTVSNLGMYGVTDFQAIINPPQAAILAISGIQEAPVVKNGAVVIGQTLNITLSADHRVVDGVAGAEFIKYLQKLLENPVSLIL